MDDSTILGAALGQLGQTAKKVGQQVVKIPEEIATDASGQVGGSAPLRQGSEGQVKSNEQQAQKSDWKSDEERIKFLRELYGSAPAKPDTGQYLAKQDSSVEKTSDKSAAFAEATAAKPEEQKELMALRNQLHKEVYFDPTFNPVKKQEERPAEKVENEKKQEMQDLQQKEEKKPPPLAVVREQNKAEMFRGASG